MSLEPKYESPITVVRIGVFSGSNAEFGRAVKRYDQRAEELKVGLGNTVKFGLYDPSREPYLLIVSHQIKGELSPYGHNTTLTVTSDSESRARVIAAQFEEKAELALRDAPSQLVEMMQGAGLSFIVFKKHGSDAMRVLTG